MNQLIERGGQFILHMGLSALIIVTVINHRRAPENPTPIATMTWILQ